MKHEPTRGEELITKAKALVRFDSAAVENSGLAPRSKGLVRLLIAFALTLAILALTAAPASANSAHVFSTSFGASGSGDGQLSLVPADPNVPTGGSGVAVNSTSHDLYVADTANARIDQFSSAGTFIRAFGADVGGAGVNVCTTGCAAGTPGSGPGAFTTPTFIAVDNSCFAQGLTGAACTSFDPSDGDVYVGDTATNTVSKFSATGAYISTNDGSTATDGPFGSLAGVAVDTTGNLFVYDQNARIFSFAQDGTFTADFSSGFGVNPSGIAVDSSDDLYVVRGAGFVEKLGPSGNDLGAIDSANQNSHHDTGLALDPSTDELYVDKDGTQIDHYAPSSCHPTGGDQGGCTPAESFGSAQLTAAAGLAVDSATGTVYAADAGADQLDAYTAAIGATTGAATDLQTTAATLHGTVNPDGTSVTDCHFDYGTTASYGQTAPCLRDDNNGTDVGSGTADVPVHADLTGLTGGTIYHFRLVATDALATARGDDQTFSTLPVPVIDSVAATNLTPTTADLTALVNPAGLQLTDCHFEYGTDTSYGTSVPCSPDAASIPADSADHPVSAHLTGLTPDTTYHFRVLATDANATTTTTDHTFIYDTAGQGLPDARAYEQVTPVHKNGALIAAVGFGITPQVSDGGSAITASSIQCFADAGSCHVEPAPLGSPYAFTRTPAGWQTTALSPPATQFPVSNEFSVPNPDDATALFSAPTQPSGEDDLYARQPGGSFTDIGPLTPPAAGTTPAGATNASDATADLSHVLWQATANGLWPSFDATTVDPNDQHASVYEYAGTADAQPLLVGVGGPNGGPGSTDLISTCGTALGGSGPDQGILSSDGRTAFFTARRQNNGDPCPGGSGANAGTPVPAAALYARVDGELPDAHTVPVSERSPADCGVPSGCQSSPPADANFEGASADGSRAFFTSTQQLTDAASQDPSSDDTATSGLCSQTTGANGCNLYLYDASKPAGHQLTAVSAGDSSGGGPRVQGVVAISRDGSHVYFVANGALAPGAGPGDCHHDPSSDQVVGHCNLYAYDAGSGDLSFVASLPGFDHSEWSFNTPGDLAARMASVTPDGRFLVFESHGILTPDDTSASGAAQIFRYDAQTGDLARISIGEKGFADNGNRSAASPCGFRVCSEDASVVPELQPGRTDPTMSHDGAYVFFNSPLALTPHALDDVQIGTDDEGNPQYAQNVYEWHGGHVSLISDGRDTTNNHGASAVCPDFSSVCLLGADGSGQNVFFTSADQLVPQDTDTELDFYDARVGGGIPFTPPPAPCSGDNCKPPPSATPPDQTPGSSSLSGPGNQGKNLGGITTPKKKKCKKGHKGRKCRKHNRAANANRGGSK